MTVVYNGGETEVVDYERAFNALMLDCGLVCEVDDAVEEASFCNREDVERAKMCRCFSCGASVDPAEVCDWTDGGETAICPECFVDLVVPDVAGIPLDPDFVAAFALAREDAGMELLFGTGPGWATATAPARSLVAACKAPVCYHGPNELLRANLGYAQGIAGDGTPFEADLWLDGEDLWATLVLPDQGWEDEGARPPVVPCAAPAEVRWACHLVLGMAERTGCESGPDLVRYVDWAEEQGLVGFSSQERAGVAHALTDIDGTDCVAIDVGLRVDGRELGGIAFELQPFPGRTSGKVVDLASRRRQR